jgi:hypothetical protein
MTDTSQAVIQIARHRRAGRVNYTVCVFHADGTHAVSPRLHYDDALRYAHDHGAAVVHDDYRLFDECEADDA